MKIVIAEKISASAVDLLREPCWIVITSDQMDGGLAAQLKSADALIVRSAVQVNAELLAHARKLRVIGRAGVGVDNIDLEPATRQGIAVMNTPGANAVAVAEHTLAMMLALARHLCRANELMHARQVGEEISAGHGTTGQNAGYRWPGESRHGSRAPRTSLWDGDYRARSICLDRQSLRTQGISLAKLEDSLRGIGLSDFACRPQSSNHWHDQRRNAEEDEARSASGELRARGVGR